MSFRKTVISSMISVVLIAGSVTPAFAFDYKVQSGDTFWIISKKFSVDINDLMEANNANEYTTLYVGQNLDIPLTDFTQYIHTVKSGDTFWKISERYGVSLASLMELNDADEGTVLYVGDKILIPGIEGTSIKTYTVQKGDTYWKISQRFGISLASILSANSANENSTLLAGQKIIIPLPDTNELSSNESTEPYITYINYTVKKGDDPWSISEKMGIPYNELLQENNLSESSILNIGDVLRIPVHHVPIKATLGPEYGELLDWWTEAQYVVPIGAAFIVHDFYTGKSFWAKRTYGASHGDIETLDAHDTATFKEIFGGTFSWEKRPIIVEYNGRRLAASMSGMPHAGNDAAPANEYTSWRSDNWGAGINYDAIKGNNMDGHFDIYFLNSVRHKDGQPDETHQENVKIAAGIK